MGIRENIDAILLEYDITQETLARIAGVAPSAVSRWRSGSIPRRSAAQRVCEYFSLPLDALLSDDAGMAQHDDDFQRLRVLFAAMSPDAREALLSVAQVLANETGNGAQ